MLPYSFEQTIYDAYNSFLNTKDTLVFKVY